MSMNLREARKRQKELETRLKQQAKLSSLEQARLEVEAHENALDVLLSVHKEQSAPFDWHGYAAALSPHGPLKAGRHEFAVLLEEAVSQSMTSMKDHDAAIAEARLRDEQEHASALANHRNNREQWETLQTLARGVLRGEARAYCQAVAECSALAEVSNLGASIALTVHDPELIECVLNVNGRDIIPSTTKSLTAAGKVSTKAMPKARYHEIYQDYVCGCVLRLARELLALLPVETVLVTAKVDETNPRHSSPVEVPVLSVAIPRATINQLTFETLDPGDAMTHFLRRGDVKASRKSGEFLPVTPLTPSDLPAGQAGNPSLSTLIARLRQLRAEVREDISEVARVP